MRLICSVSQHPEGLEEISACSIFREHTLAVAHSKKPMGTHSSVDGWSTHLCSLIMFSHFFINLQCLLIQ